MPELKPFTPSRILSLEARATSTNGQLRLSYHLRGDLNVVAFPAGASQRRDELWKHTCFEAFVNPNGGDAYYEINLAPSGDWNVYALDSYRQGMRAEKKVVGIGEFSFRRAGDEAWLESSFDLSTFGAAAASGFRLGLTAVIETTQGEKSYWALHHPAAKPDFHDQRGFQLELAPAFRN